jgi:pilus assembly protein CpaF
MNESRPGPARFQPVPGALVVDVRSRVASAARRASSSARERDREPVPEDRPGSVGAGSTGAGFAGHVGAATLASGRVLGVRDLHRTVTEVREHTSGLGPLRALTDDPTVTDVLVNGGGEVWVDRGGGPERAPVDVGGEPEVRALAVRLAGAAGRRLDEARPWVDARLPGGIRLHAVVPPLAPEGTHLSLRILRERGPDFDAMIDDGTVLPPWREVLRALISSRAAFLITGGTGAGKTTLLSALLGEVSPDQRIVLVEDVGELRPQHPHVVRLEARHANVEGRGEVGLDELVRLALRMRPDRLVVGECRGGEVRDLLSAMNTGHEGGCGTLHANSPAEVPARLIALGALAGLAPEAVRVQAAAALDAVVHLRRAPDGRRRVVELAAVTSTGTDGLRVLTALSRGAPSRSESGALIGPGWPVLAARLGLPGPEGQP